MVFTMITLILLFVLGLAGWTVSTLMSKGKHQEEIKGELTNIFESLKYLSASVSSLVKLLMKDSISSAKEDDFGPIKSNVIDLLKLDKKEKDYFNILCRGSALRYLLTRSYDWLNTPKDAYIKIKDPKEYIHKLNYHRNLNEFKDYLK